MRMSFVIKAGNRPLNLSWGMHTVTVTVCAALWSLSYISTAPQIDTRREWRQNRVRHAIVQVEFIWEEACGTVTVMLNYVISEQLALFSSTRVVYLHRHKQSNGVSKWGFKYFTEVLGSRYYLLSRQHVNAVLSLALSALPVLPLGGLSAFRLEVVKYSLMYVNEIHSWNKPPLSFFPPLSHSASLPFFSPLFLSSISVSLPLSLPDELGPGSSKWAGPHKNSIRFHRAIFAKASLDSRVMITIKRWNGAGRKAQRKKCGRYINHNVLQCLPTINLMQYLKSRFRI